MIEDTDTTVSAEGGEPVEPVAEAAPAIAAPSAEHPAHTQLEWIEAEFVKFYDVFKQRIADIRSQL
jgi:hypothetical protein